jgi:hypothetical protein
MKNIQVIDGALNATYSLFAATESEFLSLFPDGQDIAFADELWARLGERPAQAILEQIWQRPVWKPSARGIHGTLFFGLDSKKAYYPSRREAEVVPTGLNEAQRQLYARKRE